MKTDAEIVAEIKKLKGIHPQEIGCRVGRLILLLEEILKLRAENNILQTSDETERAA